MNLRVLLSKVLLVEYVLGKMVAEKRCDEEWLRFYPRIKEGKDNVILLGLCLYLDLNRGLLTKHRVARSASRPGWAL